MLKVYRLCASLGWGFGMSSLVLAFVIKFDLLPIDFFMGTSPRGMLDLAAVWFLLSLASRSIFQLESKHGTLP